MRKTSSDADISPLDYKTVFSIQQSNWLKEIYPDKSETMDVIEDMYKAG